MTSIGIGVDFPVEVKPVSQLTTVEITTAIDLIERGAWTPVGVGIASPETALKHLRGELATRTKGAI